MTLECCQLCTKYLGKTHSQKNLLLLDLEIELFRHWTLLKA